MLPSLHRTHHKNANSFFRKHNPFACAFIRLVGLANFIVDRFFKNRFQKFKLGPFNLYFERLTCIEHSRLTSHDWRFSSSNFVSSTASNYRHLLCHIAHSGNSKFRSGFLPDFFLTAQGLQPIHPLRFSPRQDWPD